MPEYPEQKDATSSFRYIFGINQEWTDACTASHKPITQKQSDATTSSRFLETIKNEPVQQTIGQFTKNNQMQLLHLIQMPVQQASKPRQLHKKRKWFAEQILIRKIFPMLHKSEIENSGEAR